MSTNTPTRVTRLRNLGRGLAQYQYQQGERMLNPDRSLIIIGFKGRSVSYLTGDLALSTVICQALTLHTQEQAEMVGNMLVKHGLLDGYWVRPLMIQLAELN